MLGRLIVPRALLRLAPPGHAAAAVLAAVLLAGLAGCKRESGPPTKGPPRQPSKSESQSDGSPLLIEVTSEAGIAFIHDPVRKGDFLFPEINGAGCAFVDYDNDGRLDIYLVQSGRDLKDPEAPAKPNRLYRNRGDGTFEDVTERSGAGDTGYGQGLACGDYNNDGFVDIYVANVGGPSALLRNSGDGTFSNVTDHAGVANGKWAITPAFVDYDHDGLLDLFATNYVEWSVAQDVPCHTSAGQRDYCGPRAYQPAMSILYRNNGDGTFSDVTGAAGIDRAFGAGMGIICADFNDDTLVDVYVANDTFANQLWINRGDGTFEDRALVSGCAVNWGGAALSSMGTNVEDFDGDGDLDLFSTNYNAQGAILYLQGEKGLFTDVSTRTRLFGETAAWTGFGACTLDLFNDGSICAYIGNGGAGRPLQTSRSEETYAQKDKVLKWSPASMVFEDLSPQLGPAMNEAYISRGVAVGDYDNDGAVDLLINNNDGPARLLRNAAAKDNHWLMVRCIGPDGRRDALGAKILVTVAGSTRRRDVIVNHSYASASDPRVHFGLGPHTLAERVTVHWPGGGETTWDNVPADQVFVARHPAAG